jgi:chromosome segregation ATPase
VLKQLFEYVQQLLFLAKETQRNRHDIEELRARIAQITEKVQALAFEVQRINEREQHEREKFALKLENALLRFERLLPPPGDTQKRK